MHLSQIYVNIIFDLHTLHVKYLFGSSSPRMGNGMIQFQIHYPEVFLIHAT